MWNGFDLLHLVTGMWILIEPHNSLSGVDWNKCT